MSLNHSFYWAWGRILLYAFISLFFLTCSNDSDDDILTVTYEFKNSCNDSTKFTCVNHYPEDGESFPCTATETESSGKCSDSDVIGVCIKIPKTSEKVYYEAYVGGMIAAQNDCNTIGQTRFSNSYEP